MLEGRFGGGWGVGKRGRKAWGESGRAAKFAVILAAGLASVVVASAAGSSGPFRFAGSRMEFLAGRQGSANAAKAVAAEPCRRTRLFGDVAPSGRA